MTPKEAEQLAQALSDGEVHACQVCATIPALWIYPMIGVDGYACSPECAVRTGIAPTSTAKERMDGIWWRLNDSARPRMQYVLRTNPPEFRSIRDHTRPTYRSTPSRERR